MGDNKLPDGNFTDSDEEYINSWRNKAVIVERLTGSRLQHYAFDPDVAFVDTQTHKTISLPVWFISALEDAERTKNVDTE